jgi:phosphatidate cytidylyltransferase
MNNELIKRILTSVIISLFTFFFIIKGGIFFIIFLIFLFLISVSEWIKLCLNSFHITFGILFLIISFLSAFKLQDTNLGYFILVILIAISSDIGGFVFGKILKGPKLTRISPNKTYAGSLGGYFLSLIISAVFLEISDLLTDIPFDNFSKKYFFFIVFVSTINQLGDLTVSYFKRLKNISDTGNLLPGHGGLLDRIDGLIFAIPFSYIFYLF